MSAKNRTMEQKNLKNRKLMMKESRERRFNIQCQEYHYSDYLDRVGFRVNDQKNTGRSYPKSSQVNSRELYEAQKSIYRPNATIKGKDDGKRFYGKMIGGFECSNNSALLRMELERIKMEVLS